MNEGQKGQLSYPDLKFHNQYCHNSVLSSNIVLESSLMYNYGNTGCRFFQPGDTQLVRLESKL